jgi:hypothetical protein
LQSLEDLLNRCTPLSECHLVSHRDELMFHLHRFDDVVHIGALNVIIELLHGHICWVDCDSLVEGHRDSVGHDYLHIAGHLSYSDWVRKNKLD